MTQISCYNKSCSKGGKYAESENSPDACQHHPGAPVFHEGYKYWSCCTKKTSDFTEFLNTPGCAKAAHNPVKPPEPVKKPPPPDVVPDDDQPKLMTNSAPDIILDRPSSDLPKTDLKVIIAGSLKTELEMRKKKMEAESAENGDNTDEIKVGAPCKHNACDAKYMNEESNNKPCLFHPGAPVFHEGYKFWSCCKKRTSDFDEFLKQVGCETGRHEWMRPSEISQKKSTCRYDWHQTGKYTTITIYSKVPNPEKCVVKVNQTSISIFVAFNGGVDTFELDVVLDGVIVPEESSVEYMKTKAEIKMRKRDAFRWAKLEYTPEK